MLEKILDFYGIAKEQHYTMTFTGESCHRYGEHHSEILDKIEEMLLTTNKQELDLENEIKEMIIQLRDIMEVFHYVSSVMTRSASSTIEECDIFEEACKYIGNKWRQYGYSVTPKVHILEAHVPYYLNKYGRIDKFDESVIEREHHTNIVWDRMLSNIRNWRDRVKHREERKSASSIPGVVDSMHFTTSTLTRNLSSASRDKKQLQVEEQESIKQEQKSKVITKISTLN
jgi:hypothetical protein